ncbi:excinuclease ABC subunit UvrC [Bradymonas sediminis]|uniref:UvrABC system protein C n=1 Tax=Bradymonas sediminis TaxID=1548548 RepID=A0A2Z4FGF4_9DELT|nr:excinuclease ABC subunit UvrC [Bradymonas sediminis]AWV87814.1 excinuclease ABC subunit C [Bradymonas sediminis]TDP73907.1 excinuclease ABC subunit C [Bradymonas sediminis]
MKTFDYEAKIALIPHEPGCYLMRDKRSKIVYIGKAKDLKNRVRSYFRASGDTRHFVARLPYILGDIDVIITGNEKEAILLENTLIKEHKPKFNIRLKDDKNYLSLRIDLKKTWPRVEVVRKRKDDGAHYFGPYHSARSVRRTLHIVNRYFKLRTCPDSVLNNRSRPCLQYQIKRCPAPCVFALDREEYMQNVQEVILFLEGRGSELVDGLTAKMLAASEELEFEIAAHFRDQIEAINTVLQQQVAVTSPRVDRDAFGFYREGDRLTIQVLFVRGGKLEGARSFSYQDQEFPDAEVLSSFLNLYYNSGTEPPQEILLPMEIEESEVEHYQDIFSELARRRVYIQTPQRGAKKSLVDVAMTNAKHSFEDEHKKKDRATDLLDKLAKRLDLKHYPERIECYDISNMQGKQIVASQVTFIGGQPEKSEYRRYKMRTVHEQDDFASMREVLMRRFKRALDEDGDMPNLVVIDGGKGQLGQAMTVFEDLGIHDVELISLAKARNDKSGFQDDEITSSPERVFVPGRKNPIVLKQNSAEMYLLERLRDEAHRFAITFHKKLRRKETLHSTLDDVPGVGPKTRKNLLRHFGSLKKVKGASPAELGEVDGVGEKMAEEIHAYFNGRAP